MSPATPTDQQLWQLALYVTWDENESFLSEVEDALGRPLGGVGQAQKDLLEVFEFSVDLYAESNSEPTLFATFKKDGQRYVWSHHPDAHANNNHWSPAVQ